MTIDANKHIIEKINRKFLLVKKLQKYVVQTQQQIEDQMNKIETLVNDLTWCAIHECERDVVCEACKRYQQTGYAYECDHGFHDGHCEKCYQESCAEDRYRDGLFFDHVFGGMA